MLLAAVPLRAGESATASSSSTAVAPPPAGSRSTDNEGVRDVSPAGTTAPTTQADPPRTRASETAKLIVGFAPFIGSGRDEWLASGLSLGLSARLAASEAACVIGASEVSAAAEDFDVSGDALVEAAPNRRLGRLLGADWMVAGAVQARGARLELRLAAVPPAEGGERRETVVAESGLELEAKAAEALARMLALPDGALADHGLTASGPAWEAFARGFAQVGVLAVPPPPARRSAAATKQLATARNMLASALAADPQFTAAAAAVALASALLGDRAALKRALDDVGRPQDQSTILISAAARIAAGDNDGAEQVLVAALATRPSLIAARAREAILAQSRGRPQQARAAFAAYAERVPRDSWLLAQSSRALAALGAQDEAVAASELARERGGDTPALVYEAAARQLEAGRHDDAIRLLTASLRGTAAARSSAARLRALLARAYMLRGKDIEAVTEGERAIKALDDGAPREQRALAYLTLAHAWARLGQYDVAIEQLAIGRRYGLTSLAEIEADPKLVRFRADPRYPWGK